MRKVLFVSPFFYPEPISSGKYNTALVRELAKDADVTVLCMHPFYPDWVVEESDEGIVGVDIHRFGRSIRFPSKALLRRVILEIYFGIVAFFFVLFRHRKFDRIVNVIPPSFFSFLINIVCGAKAINIVHDLQYEYIKAKSGLIASVLKPCIRFVETVVLRRSVCSYYLSKTMRNQALSDFDLAGTDSRVAYPFINLVRQDSVSDEILAMFPKGPKHVVYSGALGEKQNGHDLIPHMMRYGDSHEEVQCHVFSQGPIFEELKGQYGGSDTVIFHDLVPEEDLWSLCVMSDVSIIPQAAGSSKGSLPSKLPNLVFARVPILCITDDGSELGDIIAELSAGESVFSWDYPAFESAITACLRNVDNYYPEDVEDRIDELFSVSAFSKTINSEM